MTKSFGIVCVLLLSLGKAWEGVSSFEPKKKTGQIFHCSLLFECSALALFSGEIYFSFLRMAVFIRVINASVNFPQR